MSTLVLLRRRTGSAAVEFAVIGSVFILLLLLIIDVSWQCVTMAALQHGAREATRYGVTGQVGASNNRPAAILQTVITTTYGVLDSSKLTLVESSAASFSNLASNTGTTSGPGTAGQIVKYTLSYQSNFLTPVAATLYGASFIKLTTVMMVKNEPFS